MSRWGLRGTHVPYRACTTWRLRHKLDCLLVGLRWDAPINQAQFPMSAPLNCLSLYTRNLDIKTAIRFARLVGMLSCVDWFMREYIHPEIGMMLPFGQQILSTRQCLKGTATPGSLRIFFALFFSLTLPLGSYNLSLNHKLQVNRYLLSGFQRLLLGLLRIRSPDYIFL